MLKVSFFVSNSPFNNNAAKGLAGARHDGHAVTRKLIL